MSDLRTDHALFRLRDAFPRARRDDTLPPGQRAISTFPRYGIARPDPPVPAHPMIQIMGAQDAVLELDADALNGFPRVRVAADFHCVAGWTARDLRWEGVRFRDVYDALSERAPVTHILVVGRDGWRATLLLEDALRDDVLIADRLDGEPLPLDHGGPFRLVSPAQYGYKNVKHLVRIELHTSEPNDVVGGYFDRLLFRTLLAKHPRARVAHEERHRSMPSLTTRRIYTKLHPITYLLGYIGARRNPR
ncbi:MAG TPA: molybdopterin-dependent oxidoreductase [Actinomycetota bacterium]|nr:molybdopterin-dependent oxidoreductase [Actinomycetota bacterium]